MTRRGFTLIELLMILIILVVMSGVIVPAYARFWEKARFDSVVSGVRDVFRMAREEAVAKDTTATVSYDPQNALLRLTVATPPPMTEGPAALENEETGRPQRGGPRQGRAVSLGERARITEFTVGVANRAGNLATLRFRSDGTCDGGRVTLQDESGRMARLTIAPATGKVTRKEEGEQEAADEP